MPIAKAAKIGSRQVPLQVGYCGKRTQRVCNEGSGFNQTPFVNFGLASPPSSLYKEAVTLNKITKAAAQQSPNGYSLGALTFQSLGRQAQLWWFRDSLPPRLFASESRDGAAASLQQHTDLSHFQNFAQFVLGLRIESTLFSLSCGSFGKSMLGSFIPTD